jgi:SAM-dependent methyltransferase
MEHAEQAIDYDRAQAAEESSTHAKRASSFGAAASAYHEHRPDYPFAAIMWALEPVIEANPPMRALDLGAGTGKLTAQLASLSAGTSEVSAGRLRIGQVTVTAVEPDPAMLGELRRRLPGVTAVAGRAEAIPLPDASVDAVLAGQAAHWFDLDRALPEIARVLRSGGVFAGLWNANDSRVDWVDGLHQATGGRTVVPILAPEHEDRGIADRLRKAGELFWPPEEQEFAHSQLRTADSMIATLSTHSMFLVMEPPEREAVLEQVRDFLAATPETASGEFSLPMLTLALRSVRR